MNNKRELQKISFSKKFTQHETKFLKKLIYWSSSSKGYGIQKDERIWIYNTLDQWAEQIGVSKSTIQRVIRSLKQAGIINSAYLSRNKRDRTLFYSINAEMLAKLSGKNNYTKSSFICSKTERTPLENNHMFDHMYIEYNNNKFHKSYKSENIDKNKKGSDILTISTKNSSKPTIVQDMIKILKNELPNVNFKLNKVLAKYLVAAFKTKFNFSLEEWKKYLKLIKTSSYLIGEKFKLTLSWIIKFFTIDRLRKGDLGVDEGKIPVDQDLAMTEALEHIKNVFESDVCKNFRKKIVKIFSPSIYNSWFQKISFVEVGQGVFMKQIDESRFIRDYIETNFCGTLDVHFA